MQSRFTRRTSLESSRFQKLSPVFIFFTVSLTNGTNKNELINQLNYWFRSRNQEAAWEKIIRPGIKQNLIGALLASQDNMVNRKNSFQLYGADFVMADDFSVWLLEINTNPRLHPPSSEVTAKLYPEVIEDAMKGKFF